MDVFDFCGLCTDDTTEVRIYDMNPAIEHEVFVGSMWDAQQSPFSDCEVSSFDLERGLIILNIDTAEEG